MRNKTRLELKQIYSFVWYKYHFSARAHTSTVHSFAGREHLVNIFSLLPTITIETAVLMSKIQTRQSDSETRTLTIHAANLAKWIISPFWGLKIFFFLTRWKWNSFLDKNRIVFIEIFAKAFCPIFRLPQCMSVDPQRQTLKNLWIFCKNLFSGSAYAAACSAFIYLSLTG